MADVKVTLKRVIDGQGNTDNIHPTTDWDQVENKPTTFTPTAHTLNSHTDVNAVPTAAGQVLTWDADNSVWIASTTAGGGVSKADLQNVYVYGKASGAITIGQAVQFAGAEGDHILIKAAVPSEINANPNYMIGIAETTLANNEFGYVIVNGRLVLDTSTYTAGDILYFDSTVADTTTGALTTTEPTEPDAIIEMAAVSISGVGNGEFVIRNTVLTRTISEINGLQDALDAKVNKSGDTMTGNLRVESGSFASLILDREGDTSSSNVIQFENNNGVVGGIGGFGNDGLQFRTKDGTQMVIDASNNVGIGTTSPTGKLNIVDTTTRGLEFEEITGGVMRMLAFDRTNSTYETLRINGSDLEFRVGTNTAMVVDADGDVGIGTTNPTRKLQVEGGDFYTSGKSDSIGAAVGYGGSSFQIRNGSTSEDLNFDIYNRTSSAWYTPLIIKNTGNVGIGTTSPSEKLSIAGNLNLTNGANRTVRLGSATNYYYDIRSINDDFGIYEAGTTPRLYIKYPDGNVGIGITNPTFKLAIDGGSQTRGIAYFTQASPTNSLALDATTSTLHKIYTNDAAANLSLGTNNSTNQLYLKNDGKVGIGTASPAEKLQVQGNAVINGDLTLNGDFNITGTYTQIDTNVNTTEQWLVTNDGTGPAAIINQIGAQPVIDIQDDGVSAFYIADGGNVGIGTTSPDEKLHIVDGRGYFSQDSSDRSLMVESRNNTKTTIVMRNSTATANENRIGSEELDLFFNANSSEVMRLKSNGNVGIGTTSPARKLEVAGGHGDSTIRLRADNGSNAPAYLNLFASEPGVSYNGVGIGNNINAQPYYGKETNTQGGSYVGFKDGNINFFTSPASTAGFSQRMTLQESGNVGIGTGSPVSLLEVKAPNGSIGTITVGGGNTTVTAVGEVNAALDFRSNDASVNNTNNIAGRIASITEITNGAYAGLGFYTYKQGRTPDLEEAMRIDYQGNVLIGKDTNDESSVKLNVWGKGIFRNKLQIQNEIPVLTLKDTDSTGNAQTGYINFWDSNNAEKAWIGFGTSATTDFTIRNAYDGDINLIGGNVGVGTLTPATKLMVLDTTNYGSPTLGTNSGNFSVIKTDSAADQVGDYGLLIGVDGTGNSWLQAQRVDGTATAYGIILQPSGGNVGIGTTSPSTKLDVAGVIRNFQGSGGMTLSGYATPDFGYLGYNYYNNNGTEAAEQPTRDSWRIQFGNGATKTIGFGHRQPNAAAGTFSEYMTITNTSNVGIGTTSPGNKLDVRGGIQRTNTRVDAAERYPLGHYTPGETVFEIDPTWSTDELRTFFNSNNVSWEADSSAPGGYCIQIDSNPSFGGVYGAGFPYIPIDQDDEFYMEMWIRSEAGAVNRHYLGSNEFNQSFTSLGGNPGSFGYWVMSNTSIGDTWTKVSGYIGGFSNNVGDFESGTKYWTPMMLANYTNVTGARTSYISGWKVIRVSHPGNRFFKGNVHTAGIEIGTSQYAQAIDSKSNYLLLQRDQTVPIEIWGSAIQSRSVHRFFTTAQIDTEINFLRGGTEYSNYIRSQNYPSKGYTGASDKYWIEYGSKGGHHFVVDTDGGTTGGENAFDNWTIWKGAVDGPILFQVNNDGDVGVAGPTFNYNGYKNLTIGDNASGKTGLLKFRSTYNSGNGAEIYQGTNGTLYFNINGSYNAATMSTSGVFQPAGGIAFPSNARATFGPNSVWSKYLTIGGNAGNVDANTGSIGVTNGNLHLDPASGGYATYLSFYGGTGGTAFGNGASGVVAWMGPDGDLWKGSSDNSGSKYWHQGDLPSSSIARNHAVVTLSGTRTTSTSWTSLGSATLSGNSVYKITIPVSYTVNYGGTGYAPGFGVFFSSTTNINIMGSAVIRNNTLNADANISPIYTASTLASGSTGSNVFGPYIPTTVAGEFGLFIEVMVGVGPVTPTVYFASKVSSAGGGAGPALTGVPRMYIQKIV